MNALSLATTSFSARTSCIEAAPLGRSRIADRSRQDNLGALGIPGRRATPGLAGPAQAEISASSPALGSAIASTAASIQSVPSNGLHQDRRVLMKWIGMQSGPKT